MRRSLQICVTLVALSCGGASSPLVDSNTTGLPLRPGTYVLSLSGASDVVINGTSLGGCPGIQGGGSYVTTMIALTLDANTWRARPQSSAGGSFDLSFASGPLGVGGPGGGPGILGTGSGLMLNTIPLPPTQPLRDNRVTLGGGSHGATATLTGGIARTGLVASGLISGDVTFSYPNAASITCASGTVSWTLSTVG